MAVFGLQFTTLQNMGIIREEIERLQTQKQPPEVFCKKAVLKDFAIFTGKHLCWILFLIKLPFTCLLIKTILKNIYKRLLLQTEKKELIETLQFPSKNLCRVYKFFCWLWDSYPRSRYPTPYLLIVFGNFFTEFLRLQL